MAPPQGTLAPPQYAAMPFRLSDPAEMVVLGPGNVVVVPELAVVFDHAASNDPDMPGTPLLLMLMLYVADAFGFAGGDSVDDIEIRAFGSVRQSSFGFNNLRHGNSRVSNLLAL
eukprot:gene29910-37324_t